MTKQFASRLIYPDPFKPSGIEFDLPAGARVTLALFDPEGREVARLIDDRHMEPGTHAVDFLSHGFGPGAYLYRLSVDDGMKRFVDTKRIVVGSFRYGTGQGQ